MGTHGAPSPVSLLVRTGGQHTWILGSIPSQGKVIEGKPLLYP
jgi:hypothetical protein